MSGGQEGGLSKVKVCGGVVPGHSAYLFLSVTLTISTPTSQ